LDIPVDFLAGACAARPKLSATKEPPKQGFRRFARMLRHATPADGPACAAIYRPHVLHSAVSFEEEAPDGAEMAARISAYGASHAWLVAEVDGAVAGFAYAGPHRVRTAYRWSADVSIYVDSEHRGTGLGRRLYSSLFSLLRRQGLFVACAGITLPNDASVGLHEHMGFTPIGIYRSVGYKDGAWRAVGWWQLQLAPPPPGRPPDPLGPQSLET
jgi:phosphinothricin acetyltransferase